MRGIFIDNPDAEATPIFKLKRVLLDFHGGRNLHGDLLGEVGLSHFTRKYKLVPRDMVRRIKAVQHGRRARRRTGEF